MKLKDILKDISVLEQRAESGLEITGVCYDSRKVKPGDLFVAVRGFESDGHRFIPMAVEKGAACILWQQRCTDRSGTQYASSDGRAPYRRRHGGSAGGVF